MTTIYVALLDEGTDVWRPVHATHLGGDRYLLHGVVPSDEKWAFQPGQTVRCRPRVFSGDKTELLAVETAVDAMGSE